MDGLSPNKDEVELLLNLHKIDILLVSETHFTASNNVKTKNYDNYGTNHLDGTAPARAAVIVKSNTKNNEQPQFKKPYIQAATITIEERHERLNVTAIAVAVDTRAFRDFWLMFHSWGGLGFQDQPLGFQTD